MASALETENQIRQMTQFIMNEAKDKADEISSKALQEFTVEKAKAVNSMKQKIEQDYSRKAKAIETQAAIARSTAINRSRLEKIKTRQDRMAKLGEDSKAALLKELEDTTKHKEFLTKLITQGMLMLLEDEVKVRCRPCDDALVSACLEAASNEYKKAIESQAGASKQCKATLDTIVKLAPAPTGTPGATSCLGGVVLACNNGAITIDNTVDSRLTLVMEQAKPTIRELLFTSKQ